MCRCWTMERSASWIRTARRSITCSPDARSRREQLSILEADVDFVGAPEGFENVDQLARFVFRQRSLQPERDELIGPGMAGLGQSMILFQRVRAR